jgi:hypothetical protein
MNSDMVLLLIAVAALLPIGLLAAAVHWDRSRREETEKAPQQQKLLRPPGHSVGLFLEQRAEEFMSLSLWSCFTMVIAAGTSIYFYFFWKAHSPGLWLTLGATFLAICVLLVIFGMIKAFKTLEECRNLRLGLRGEQAVAEVLGEVGIFGFRSFHDFTIDGDWNIDHIVVGARGVFAIETKARRKRKTSGSQPAHVVHPDGENLMFPTWTDTKAIPQAKRNARSLSAYLTKKTGESVSVEPLVVLPGWFVQNRTSNNPVKVFNPSYLPRYLSGEKESLVPAQVRRIIAAIEEKCRDLEF